MLAAASPRPVCKPSSCTSGDRGVRPRSVNTYLQALNAFCRWLNEEGHQQELVHIPLLRTEKRVLSTLSEPQIRALLSFQPKTTPHWRVHTLIATLLDTGIRIDEALKLTWANLDLDNLLLTVYGRQLVLPKARKKKPIIKPCSLCGRIANPHGYDYCNPAI